MTAKTPKSKKAKGKTLEREVAKAYRHKLFPKAQSMPMSGAMQFNKGDIFKGVVDEWKDECKNQETTKLWEWWEQTVNQCYGLEKPVLHIKKNYSEILSVIRFSDYIELRETIYDLEEEIRRLKCLSNAQPAKE